MTKRYEKKRRSEGTLNPVRYQHEGTGGHRGKVSVTSARHVCKIVEGKTSRGLG